MNKKHICIKDTCLSELVNYLINKMGKNNLYVIGGLPEEFSEIYHTIKVEEKKELAGETEDGLYFVALNSDNINVLNSIDEDCDFLVYDRDNLYSEQVETILCHAVKCPLHTCAGDKGVVYLAGKTLGSEIESDEIPESFKVLAIMHCYNEDDIIEGSVEHIMSQGLYLYVMDNWSTDNTYSILESLRQKYPGRITVERFPKEGGTESYEWYNQLAETERVASNSDYNWFLHYDVDEIRISPWKNTTLREALFKVDSLGYNLIDNNVIDFRMTDYGDGNIFNRGSYFEFRFAEDLLVQRKTWKKAEQFDLKQTAGHTVVVENPKVFPLRVLNMHYPLRSISQATRKVFQDRIPRMRKERRTRGWHGHYDAFVRGKEFVYDLEELWKWDTDTFTDMYLTLFTGIGIGYKKLPVRDKSVYDICGKKLVVYGAGKVGKRVIEDLLKNNEIVLWVDKGYQTKTRECCLSVMNPEEIKDSEYDYVVIAIQSEDTYEEIKQYIKGLGVAEKKIMWVRE